LLPGIRACTPDLGRLTAYAEAMLGEREFFVRKATGWVLRELARTDPEFVAGWVDTHIAGISGVTLREAIRHLPEGDRERLHEAYRRERKRMP
jgi:3-methyladenine DNA glycosylase AlkD